MPYDRQILDASIAMYMLSMFIGLGCLSKYNGMLLTKSLFI